jgi:hypothetical protein
MLYFWSIAEVFLEYGADLPVWIRPLQKPEYSNDNGITHNKIQIISEDINAKRENPEMNRIILKLGQNKVILDDTDSPLDLDDNLGNWPESLQQYNHPVTFHDLLDMDQPQNAENVRRLLDRAQGLDLVTDPQLQRPDSCVPEEDVTDQKVAPEQTEDSQQNRTKLWSFLRKMILHPLLPWVLFGTLFVWRSIYL